MKTQSKLRSLTRTEKDWAWKAIDRARSTWERRISKLIESQFRLEASGVEKLLVRDGASVIPGTKEVLLPRSIEAFFTLQTPAWEKILWIAWRDCRRDFGTRQAEALGGRVRGEKAFGPTDPIPKPSPDVWVDNEDDVWVFDPASPASEFAAKTWVAEKVVRVTDATKAGIRSRVLSGLEEGSGIREIAKGIRTEGPFSTHRAHRIARTEVVAASNYGTREAAVQSGVVQGKQWVSSRDERTRHSHRAIDDETEITPLDLNTPYTVGGAKLMFPGDPAGPAKEVIHCRCSEAYVHRGRFKPTRPMPDDWDKVEDFPNTELRPVLPETSSPEAVPEPEPAPPPPSPGPEDFATRRTDTKIGKKVESQVQKAKRSPAGGLTNPKEIRKVGKILKDEIDKRLISRAESMLDERQLQRIATLQEQIRSSESEIKEFLDAGYRRSDAVVQIRLRWISQDAESIRRIRLVSEEVHKEVVLEVLSEVRGLSTAASRSSVLSTSNPGDPEVVNWMDSAWKDLPEDWFRPVDREVFDLSTREFTKIPYKVTPRWYNPDIDRMGRPASYFSSGRPTIGGGSTASVDSRIVMQVGASDSVAVHETMHMMEDRFKHLAEASNAFLDYRCTKGRGLKYRVRKLSEITGYSGYEAHEVAIQDDWTEAYIGKIYGHRPVRGDTEKHSDPTEILSMGLEGVLYRKHRIWEMDPEFAEWVLGVLAAL